MGAPHGKTGREWVLAGWIEVNRILDEVNWLGWAEGWGVAMTRLYCDVDLEWDQSSVAYPPRHLDPVENGINSGRAPLGASAYLVVEDLG